MSNEQESTTPEVVEAVEPALVPEAPAPAVQEPVLEAKNPEPEPEPESVKPSAKSSTRKPSLPGSVYSGAAKDDVSLSACVIKNKFNRKSLSVHHVQRRLEELGYRDAGSDKDGYYGDLTVLAVKQFQTAEGIDPTGVVDMRTLEALFYDDPNVSIVA